MPTPIRHSARRRLSALLVPILLLMAALSGCASHRAYYHPGYGPAPIVVVHHYGSGYGYGGPHVVHVHHYGGYGGGYGGRRPVVIHHYH